MDKILILGTGSIGSEIAYSFSNDYEIICIDHGKHFDSINAKLPKVKLVKGDIHDQCLIRKEAENSDIIFYCVDTGGVVDCIDSPSKYEDINTISFRKLLNSLNNKNVHFFLFSSIFVYPDVSNITEDTPLNPSTLYGKFRMNQEQILHESDFNYTILRLSNIFGYGHFFNVGNKDAIEKFIDCVFEGQKIILHGDGNQRVDYIYKSDLMDLLKTLVKIRAERRVFNVSTGHVKPISKIAEIVVEIGREGFGKSVEIIKSNTSVRLPNLPKVSPNRVMRETFWKPSFNLHSRIREMMNVCKLKNKG